MIQMSINNLIEVNKIYNEAQYVRVNKRDDNCVILTFLDKEGEFDATVLTSNELDLVRQGYYLEIEKEIIVDK